MTTPVANKNRTGLMGPEHVRSLDRKAEQSAVDTAISAEAAARAEAERRAIYKTRWIAG